MQNPTSRQLAALALTASLATSLAGPDQAPPELDSLRFSGPDLTPCPACLCAAPTGELFVGVDMLGSLGKGPGKGRIVRLIDADGDGTPEKHSVFAEIDNPRGLISVGTRLYVLHTVIPQATGKLEAMHLSVLEDRDRDGIADGKPELLVSDVSPPKHNQKRGADHTTNGIRMGIDGWIYIAVGDFGIHGARGTDGTELTMLGGGVVRVRPDGTELEIYTHGLRNIYDVAIDPLMNIYTRGNTNDGGGWNIRFIHHIQSGEYGYPVLFKNFTDEIIPALQDLGGGSGTGALYLQEPGWPGKFNNVPMMCDWGRSQLFIHRLAPDGASFTQKPEDFIRLSQITDLDIDGSGRMYAAAWDGAGYRGNPGKGYVQRYVPKGWIHQPFSDPSKLTDRDLVALLRTESATRRQAASQELLNRGAAADAVAQVAADAKASLDSRVAAIFTYKQMAGTGANPVLATLAAEPVVREWALRAMTDRRSQLDGMTKVLHVAALQDENLRVRVAAAVGLGRLGDQSAAQALLAVSNPPTGEVAAEGSETPPSESKAARKAKNVPKEGPHATPNPAILLPHVAVKALVSLQASQECVAAVGGPQSRGALWALRLMHDAGAVEGLMDKYASSASETARIGILDALLRVYHKEAPYDGSWWWGTRPDTRGPYYRPVKWQPSERIEAFVRKAWDDGDPGLRGAIARSASRNRVSFKGIDATIAAKSPVDGAAPALDLAGIAARKGQVGAMPSEDVMIALKNLKGNPLAGKELFARQGCIACHTTETGQALKGPYMGQVGAVLTPEQIAESILKPSASISQGFATAQVQTKDQKTYVGFVTAEKADEIEIRDLTGKATRIRTADIEQRSELDMSMMPPGLANAMSLEEFASLVAYLSAQKG